MEDNFIINYSYPPYYNITVQFDDKSFEQTIISELSNEELTEFFTDYSDQYKDEWYTLPIEVES